MYKRVLLLLVAGALGAPLSLHAADDILLPGNAASGKKIYDAKCTACHVSLVGGDGTAIHTRPARRIKTAEGLVGRVQGCNHQLKAGLNPDQINDIVAHLYQAYYKAPAK